MTRDNFDRVLEIFEKARRGKETVFDEDIKEDLREMYDQLIDVEIKGWLAKQTGKRLATQIGDYGCIVQHAVEVFAHIEAQKFIDNVEGLKHEA